MSVTGNRKLRREIFENLLVRPGENVRLKDRETGWAPHEELKRMGKDEVREQASEVLDKNLAELREAQELLWASDTYSVLIIFQGMDAAGKDGIIKHVMSGVNPSGCQVTSFKRPSAEELDHTFLWRQMRAVPERGMIGIFNRSHYEEVLVIKVHPELLRLQKLPETTCGKDLWRERYDDINSFERHLSRNGTVILKFFLHISKEEQRRRFLDRLEDPKKLWKFSAADAQERDHWAAYKDAFEDMLNNTSTKWAPWYVIPSDYKWAARTLVAAVITGTIRQLDLHYPEVSAEGLAELAQVRARLISENGKKAKGKKGAKG
ncbi:MAG: polyphosphate kinase 2 family protein [Methanomassiliicoccus sp.]|nr:polyphosphate kinase 2 family protein [Methanomassiliicoccus sp.]